MIRPFCLSKTRLALNLNVGASLRYTHSYVLGVVSLYEGKKIVEGRV